MGVIHFLTPAESLEFPLDFIRRAGIGDEATVMAFEEVLERDALPFGAYVFTGINRLGPALARFLGAVADHLEEATGLEPLNHPTRSLRRYELIRRLHELGRSPYTAYGAWESYDGVRLPAFVRSREGDSESPELRHTPAALRRDVGKMLIDGWQPDNVVIIEFADTSEGGVFTKYSAYVVGDAIVAASLDRGPHWVMRRHGSDASLDKLAEEERYVVANPHAEALAEIFRIAAIRFGRIDYSMHEGRVVCWEINTLPLLRRPPGIGKESAEGEAARSVRRGHFNARFAEAFRAVLDEVDRAEADRAEVDRERERRSATGPPDDAIPLPPFADLRAAARREVRERGVTAENPRPRWDRLRTLLRPLKPVLKPVAEAVLQPILARGARRGG